MSTPTDPVREELRALRERVYGRDADVHADPVALARLNELEALVAAATVGRRAAAPPLAEDGVSDVHHATTDTDAAAPPVPVDAPPVSQTPEGTDGAALPSDDGAEPGIEHESATDAGARLRWWRRPIPLAWAGAAAAAALLLGAGLTLLIQTLDAGRVGMLAEDAGGEWPESFFGARPADARIFEEFYGLTVLTFP